MIDRWLLCVTLALSSLPAFAIVTDSHAITLRGEPELADGFAHFPYANPTAPKGGELRLSAMGTFDSLNPFINKGVAVDGIERIYDSLTKASEDEFGTRYGLLAKRIIRDPQDSSWVIYELRPEARFADGHPVDADDVVFTFNTLLRDGSPAYKAYFADVKRVTALSPHRVRFDFASKENRELPMTVGEVAILPKHDWQQRPFNQTSLQPPLGSGPYHIASIDAGRRIVYQRNPDYWGRHLSVNRGLHNFDRISYHYYRDGSVAFEGFKAHQYDVREENKAKTWATEYNFPAVNDGRVILTQQTHANPAPMQGFAFNTRRTLFQDRRVREALSLAFDFEWSNRALFYGAYTRTQSYYANSALAANGKPSAAELALLSPWRAQLPTSVFGVAVSPTPSNGDGYNRSNLLKAQQLLKASGWQYQQGALRDRQGQAFRFEMLLVQPEFERIVQPFKRNLARLGIALDIRILDASQYIERLRQFDFDSTVSGVPASLSPGNELWSFWGSQNADTPGSNNLVGLRSPVVDRLIDHITRADSRDELQHAVRALDRVLRAEWLFIPQYHIGSYRIARWNHFGLPNRTPRFGVGMDSWWRLEAKEISP